MKHAMLTLDYFALSKEAKALKISSAAKVIRIALLADCATQHLATIMRAIASPHTSSSAKPGLQRHRNSKSARSSNRPD
jgi:hypothetical protein